ncbi:MAG: hypothetical protein JSV68_10420 [Anaerolineaceae bacterium]|nr:MAG: hypothetical protein JSV68_10420 [Anaerolineaceae bacterium]
MLTNSFLLRVNDEIDKNDVILDQIIIGHWKFGLLSMLMPTRFVDQSLSIRPKAPALRRPNLTSTQKIVFVVGLIYLGLFLFFFRDVIVSIPAIWRGEVVINGDELVPFFNPYSQLLDQAAGKFNQLTNGYEFRVRYSFLTTWMRYYKVLPLAILFVIPTVVFVGYWSVARFLSKVFSQFDARDVYILTAAPVLMIFMVMIYSKITHFYTLVLGFALFLVAALAMTDGLIFPQKRPYTPIIIACLVTLFNPAVHYLILFALYLSMTVATLILLDVYEVIRHGYWRLAFRWRRYPEYIRYLWRNWKRLFVEVRFVRTICAFALLGILALAPYGAFVKFVALRGVPNLSETVPGDYYFIKDASISLGHMLAFDMAGIMDKLLTGDYLAKVPRWPNMAYMILMFLPLLWRRVRQQLAVNKALGAFLYVTYASTLFSMWATMGYSGASWVPTFHRTIAFISIFANGTQSAIGDLVVRLMGTIVQVLRFPHRFELIMLMMACVLLPMNFLWLHRWLQPKIPEKWIGLRRHFTVILAVLFFVPFFSNTPYRTVFFSGNFYGFLTPYPVEPLKQVKDYLLKLPPGKVVVLPPTETAKAIVDINGNEHKFIDKFHIYYLDLPSYYYGLTGDSDNKHEFFLMLRAMYYGQGWWVNVARDLNLKYIVINKELVANTVGGQEYLREVERIIIPELDSRSEYLTKLFENESYVLYDFTDLPKAERVPLYIDTDWNTFLQVVSRNLELTRHYDLRYPMVVNDLEEYDYLSLLTDDPQNSWLNLYIKKNKERYFRPSSTILPFNPNMISSAYYLSPMFRLFQFFSDSKYNRLNVITPGLWGTIQGGFIGLPRATEFRIDVALPEDGEYRLLMRGAASANTVNMSANFLPQPRQIDLQSDPSNLTIYDKQTVFTTNRETIDPDNYAYSELERLIPIDTVAINYQYQFFDLGKVEGSAGKYTIYFDKIDNAPLLLEGIVVVPEDVYQEQTWPMDVKIITKDDLCCGVLVQDTEAVP